MSKVDTDAMLRRTPERTRHNTRGQSEEYKAVVKIGEPTKLSTLLAQIAGHDSIKKDPMIMPGTVSIVARVDIKPTSR